MAWKMTPVRQAVIEHQNHRMNHIQREVARLEELPQSRVIAEQIDLYKLEAVDIVIQQLDDGRKWSLEDRLK